MSVENNKRTKLLALILSICMLTFTISLQGCGDSDDPVPVVDPIVDPIVDPAGTIDAAVVTTVAGPTGSAVTAVFPAGSADDGAVVTIVEGTEGDVASTSVVGTAYTFAITGQTGDFDTPVTITVPYDATLLAAAGKTPSDILLYTMVAGGTPELVTTAVVDDVNEVVTAEVSHFSTYWAAVSASVVVVDNGVTVATNVFLDGIVPDTDYMFFHGSTSPDGSKFFIAVNDTNPDGSLTFASDLYMLNTQSVTENAPALDTTVTTNVAVATGDASGPQGATITFRSNWTPDGSKILLSGADRFFVIDSDTLAVLNGNIAGNQGDTTIGGTTLMGQNHDALGTSDSKYALLTVRTKPNGSDGNTDGAIQLYDIEAGEPIGEPVSVCNACHNDDRSAVLCGLDGEITLQTDGTYTGTIYVAGHGGHFAQVDLVIDPTNTSDPIGALSAWGNLNMRTVSNVKFAEGDSQYKLHDVRKDGNTLYWSTYTTDINGQVHYGTFDTVSNTMTADVAYDIDARATSVSPGEMDKGSIYCASGQTDKYHMPITMTKEAYITVIPKNTITGTATPPASTVSVTTDVFLDSIVPDEDYMFFHGSTSPDGSKFFIAVNDTNPDGSLTFSSDLYMLDTESVTADDPTLDTTVTTNTATAAGDASGPQGATITFRSNWTPDGSKILLAGADRFFVLDSDTFAVLNGDIAGNQGDTTIGGTTLNGQNHDALSSDDGKYALLTLRTKPEGSDGYTDGALQLYDVVNGAPIGEPVSVCNACHAGVGKDKIGAVLCGLDGDLMMDETAPAYASRTSCTVYVAGHGGHIAVVELTAQPENAAEPIVINSLTRITVSGTKFPAEHASAGQSQYKLHDVRKDGDTLYWSTYTTDANGQIHYGKINTDGTGVVDKTYEINARATSVPEGATDKGSIYCASGQTDLYHMPITMTKEAYITVIPKGSVK